MSDAIGGLTPYRALKNPISNNSISNNSISNNDISNNKNLITPSQVIQPYKRSDHIVEPNNRIDVLKEIFGEKVLKQRGIIPCMTCESRTYVDGSDDPGVSFKSPGRISPEASDAVVAAHEGEHVVNERAKAEQEDREVISQNVRTFKDICPECGKMYTSGGVTHTTTQNKPKYKTESPSIEGTLLDITI